MTPAEAVTNRETPIRKYELGRPIIRREQRSAFERIQHAVAQSWSDSMAEYLPDDAAIEFEGVDFDAFSSVSIDESPSAQIVLFAIDSTPISGFMMMSAALAKFLVRCRLGLNPLPGDRADGSFTRIETAVAHEMTRSMLARLSEEYASAGLGSLGNIRDCDDLADSFVFAPEESLAMLRFRIDVAGEALHLLIALSGNVVAALAEHHPAAVAEGNGRNAIVNVVRRLPIEVEVVLGSWKVPIGELLRLRAGDKIVLPDGEDAWLAARGVRLRRTRVELSAGGASVEIRRSARMR